MPVVLLFLLFVLLAIVWTAVTLATEPIFVLMVQVWLGIMVVGAVLAVFFYLKDP